MEICIDNFFSYVKTEIRVQRLDLPRRFVRVQQRNKSTEVRPSGKIGSGTTEIPFSMFLRQPGKDNLERFYETFHGFNISAQTIKYLLLVTKVKKRSRFLEQ
ncbi:uncharacterized protein LOC126703289 isoform X2 [Quercus robur]|uniref:uncharacterized protein LOC126703289 isoform X2 n=1 Tax=Quercus robur TaxID=38942 RepID=UPI0021634ACC|nr:uncharacterized protein LOC126703289 isoform X2 [Quercus robur]